MALDDYATLFRYLHILAGITWIGLLYFFNLVNLPLLKFDLKKPFEVNMGEKASPNITLKTLFWFRWAAMFTFIFGLILIEVGRMGVGSMGAYFMDTVGGNMLLLGVILGITMWFNVWFLIWPNQQKILTNNKKIAAGASDADKKAMEAENAKALPIAKNASRYNTWASVPMLFGMVFGAHPGGSAWGDYVVPLVVLAALLGLMVVYSNKK